MPTIQSFNAQRARSYLFRIPLFTRAMLVVMVAFALAGLQSAWDIRQWGALIPNELGLTTSACIPVPCDNMVKMDKELANGCQSTL